MAEIFMLFPSGREKALTLSYDDGLQSDARLISIMKSFGLKGTFNLNSGLYAPEGTVYPEGTAHRRVSKSEATDLYYNSGMEIAVHGLSHPFLDQLNPGACSYEVSADRRNLEDQFHRIVRGMAYPYGTYSADVVDCLRRCGIAYARTTVSSHSFDLPSNWLTLAPTCHHNDPMLDELLDGFLKGKVRRKPWLFYLWGHTHEFEADGNWNRIERFAENAGRRTDIWYATNMEIYSYVQAYERLESSADGNCLYNPSSQTLYFRVNGKNGWQVQIIEPGETKDIV